jgi:hypothetical protein
MTEMFVLPQVNKARKKLLLSGQIEFGTSSLSPSQLYNLLQELTIAMILIDARPFQDFRSSFIRSAINVDLSIFNDET